MIAKPISCALEPGGDPPWAGLVHLNADQRRHRADCTLFVRADAVRLAKGALMQILAALRRRRVFRPTDTHEDERCTGELPWHGTRVRWRSEHVDLSCQSGALASEPGATTRLVTITLSDGQ